MQEEEDTSKSPPCLASPRKTETARPDEKTEPSVIPSEESISFHLHERVEARYHGRGRRFYTGKIVKVLGGNRYDVDYDDGDTDRNISSSSIRALDGTQVATLPVEISVLNSPHRTSQRDSAVSGTTAYSLHTPLQDEETGKNRSSPAIIETKEPSVSSSPSRNLDVRNSFEDTSRFCGVDERQGTSSRRQSGAKSYVSPKLQPHNDVSRLDLLEKRMEAYERMMADTNAKLDQVLRRNCEAAALAKNLQVLLGGTNDEGT